MTTLRSIQISKFAILEYLFEKDNAFIYEQIRSIIQKNPSNKIPIPVWFVHFLAKLEWIKRYLTTLKLGLG